MKIILPLFCHQTSLPNLLFIGIPRIQEKIKVQGDVTGSESYIIHKRNIFVSKGRVERNFSKTSPILDDDIEHKLNLVRKLVQTNLGSMQS